MSGPVPFQFDPARASAILPRMGRAPDAPVAMHGDDWAQGAMGALVRAELLAAQAGVVPWVMTEGGEPGIALVGAARERIDAAPEDVRTIYLATHAAVRTTHARAAEWHGTAPALEGAIGNPLVVPAWAIVLCVGAVASALATAWYLTGSKVIESVGTTIRQTAYASRVADLARDELAKTGRISPGAWEALRRGQTDERDEDRSWWPWAIGGGVAVAGAGALAWKWNEKNKGQVRR